MDTIDKPETPCAKGPHLRPRRGGRHSATAGKSCEAGQGRSLLRGSGFNGLGFSFMGFTLL